jgi:thiosulfate/3-mercaptopyruvate sulfurtransferase
MSLIRTAVALALVCATLALPAMAAPVLVDSKWLAANLNKNGVIVIDIATDGTQYDRFHLPGAIYLPYYAIVKPRKKDRVTLPLSQPELAAVLGRFGISRDRHVVIYDDMGGLNAGRLFWALEQLGHPDVSVLDGGLVKWILEGRKVVNVPTRPRPVQYRPASRGRDNSATMQDVDQASQDGVSLIDARSIEEYVGDPKKSLGGHVAGARWWEWSRSIDVAGGFVRKPAANLLAELNTLGVGDKKRPVITYCRSGHRAAQAYLTLRSLGYENVKLYANSMNEYGRYRAKLLKPGTRP